jgi:hypothetical protein
MRNVIDPNLRYWVFIGISVWFSVLYHVQQVPSVSLYTEKMVVGLAFESAVPSCVRRSCQTVAVRLVTAL